MTFEETPLEGAYIVRPERSADVRGAFKRLWCTRELESRGLNGRLAQASLSTNRRRGTLRGMHHQKDPRAEEKLITCLAGSLYDVIVDIREGSPTVGRWFAMRLSADEPVALYIPKGFAHGFVTLEDDTALLYQITEFYDPALAAGFRWNDPTFAIVWPLAPEVVSDRDCAFPDFAPVPGIRL